MIEAVSDIIEMRSRPPEGLRRMVAISAAVHIAVVAGIAVAPAPDFADDAPRTVMTISLGGAPGPQTGGMTPIAGRAIQAPAPAAAPRVRSEPPPAPTRPEMTLPSPTAKPRPPQPKPRQAPPEASGRAPSTGPEVREGAARADTGARGQGFGLTTGGGGGTGAQLDVSDFCCPEYVQTVVQRIHQNWAYQQNMTGQVVVKFTIQRDGTITEALVEKPSGLMALDTAAFRAVQIARVPPLPDRFSNPSLTVHLTFNYQR